MGDDTVEQGNAESPGSDGASPYHRLVLSISFPTITLPIQSPSLGAARSS
jgi:hypothetical protein